MLEAIFDKQKQLVEAFHGVEHPLYPNIDTLVGQNKLRLTIYFFLEELTEARHAEPSDLVEEFADALHFLVELALFSGLTPEEVEQGGDLADFMATGNWEDVYATAMLAGHELKFKPWKQNPKLTSSVKFRQFVRQTFAEFFALVCQSYGIDSQVLYEAYHAKHRVNNQRIADKL